MLLDIVVNWCMAILKARAISIILVDTNWFNVWVRLPLLAGKLYELECNQLEIRVTLDWEGENIKVGFQPVPPNLVDINNHQVEAEPIQPASPKIE